MSKKILHVITGLDDGGAEAVLYNLCLVDKDNIHIVVSLKNIGKYGSLLSESGVEVLCLNQKSSRFNFSAFLSLYRFIKSRRPTIVQTWMFHADLIGGLAARLAGVRPVLWGVHHATFDSSISRSTRAVFMLNRWLSYFVPDKIICCSQAGLRHLQNAGFMAKKLVFIANGYDLSRFKPDSSARKSVRADLGVPQDSPVICVVGRYHPLKDHQNLLKALSVVRQSIPEFLCLCIGPGVDGNNVELTDSRSALGLNDNVRFLGSSNQVPMYMAASDLLVLPSRAEAFPNVLNEAMACGVPCVTTDVGDAAYIVGETGWVSPPKNPEALAGKILEAIAAMGDSEAYALRRVAARKWISDNFSIQAMIANYHKAWGCSK